MEPLNEFEKQFVKQILAENSKFRGVESNLHFVLDAVSRSNARGEEINETLVRRVISSVAPQLATNAQYAGAFQQFFMTHPELAVDANENILAKQSQQLFGAVSAENLELLFSDPQVKAQLVFSEAHQSRVTADRDAYNHELQQATTTAAQGASMILDLTKYLIAPDGEPKGKTRWDKAILQKRLDSETAALMALSFDELSEKHEAWLYKHRLESMTADEVRSIVKLDDLARRATYTEFQPLPQSYSPPNKETVFIPWSHQLLTKLPAAELARLMQLYGHEQLNSAAAAQGRH
jgi:hypothetical protein